MALTLEDLLPLLSRLSAERDRAISLGELSEAAGRSRAYFQRAFTRLVGESPKKYATRLRLEHAALLLVATETSVLEIALEAGFASHEGFTRAFHRHYGLAPRDFRRRGLAATPAQLQRHLTWALHLGPCVGLYRATLDDHATRPLIGEPAMSYDITQKRLEAQPVLYRAARCEQAAIAQTLSECLPSIATHAAQNGIAMVGPPYTRYLSWGPTRVSIEAGIPVPPGSAGAGAIEVGELPACTAAVTIHTGPYDGLTDAHGAVERWIEAQGLEPDGPPWEVYVTDPGEVPNPDEWKTEVVWPIKSA